MAMLNARPTNQAQRGGGGKRQKVDTIPVYHFTNALGVIDFVVEVHTPSARLAGALEVFFEPDNQSSVLVSLNAEWALRAYTFGVNKDRAFLNYVDPVQVPFPAVLSTYPLPRSYEWNTGIRLLQAQLALGDASSEGPVLSPGIYYARARWEPNTDISDEELVQLFNECSIKKISGPE